MDTRMLVAKVLIIVGSIAMLPGAIDPLEGAIIAVSGSAMVSLGVYLSQPQKRKLVYAGFMVLAIYFATIMTTSALGGWGPNAPTPVLRSNWWNLCFLLFLMGWYLCGVGVLFALAQSFKGPWKWASTATWGLAMLAALALHCYLAGIVLGVSRTPIETKRVKGALEAEKMTVLGKTGGDAQEQWMKSFGTEWSGDAQLWWTNAKRGDRLDLGFDVQQQGTYKLTTQFTKAADYGIAQLYLDGEKVAGPIDFFNDGVIVSGVLDLGSHELDVGQHKLTVEIVGANPRAVPEHMVGIDYFKLELVGK